MPDQKLQEPNVQMFETICKALVPSKSQEMPELISTPYRGCDNDVPFFKECLAIFCSNAVRYLGRSIQSTSGPTDDMFWTIIKSSSTLAMDVAFYTSKAFFELEAQQMSLEEELSSEREYHSIIWQRLSARQRLRAQYLEFSDREPDTISWHQKVPSNGTSEYFCLEQSCCGYFTDHNATNYRMHPECLYCLAENNIPAPSAGLHLSRRTG
jgi:hypothetical protein